MVHGMGPIDMSPGRLVKRISQNVKLNPNWQFARDIGKLIAEYRWYSLAILCVTVVQELAALWPVNLLGDFVDRLETGNLGNVVLLFMGASVLAPAIMRGNIILRHKMFYETDFQKRVELILESSSSASADAETAGATNTRIANAVSGITNATYYVLGNFTPIIIKITVVFGNLMAYNRILGITYLASLIIPTVMTIAFNNWLKVLRDAQYSVMSRADGTATKFFASQDKQAVGSKVREVMAERKNILIALISKHQISLFVRQAALIGSQFLVVFIALASRQQLGLTAGDFTKIVGYTTQVAAAFIETAACLDAIVSHSRAYHVYAQAKKP